MKQENIQTVPKTQHNHSKKSSLGEFQYSQPNVVFNGYNVNERKESFSLVDESIGERQSSYKEAISSIHNNFGHSVSAQDNQEQLILSKSGSEYATADRQDPKVESVYTSNNSRNLTFQNTQKLQDGAPQEFLEHVRSTVSNIGSK